MEKIKHICQKLELPESFWNEFQIQSEILYLNKNDFFVKAGRPCKYIGIVESGALFSFVSPNENQIVNDLFVENSFVTYYRSFLTQLPASGSIQCVDDCIIYGFSIEKYNSLMNNLDWIKLFKYISDRLFIKKCARENSFMKMDATERYHQLIQIHPGIEQKFPQYTIASYIGIKPETLSRIKKS